MKTADSKQTQTVDVPKVAELLALAVIAARDSMVAHVEGLKQQPHTVRFAEEMLKKLDVIDYATTALAAELGWSVFPGAGASVRPELLAKAENWARRGKKDPVS